MNNYSPLLINEPAIQVLPSLAVKVGLDEAIVLQQLQYWMSNAKAGAQIEGHKWIYNSYSEWRENFPFWSERTIRRVFASLEEQGVVIAKQFNKAKGDATKFYRIAYDVLGLGPVDNLATPPVDNLAASTNTETTIPETTDKKDVSVERDINKGKVKEIPPSPQRGGATASRGVNSSEQSLLQEDEAPTQERISALKRVELDRELLAAFNLIHQIAGLSKPVTMNKSDKKLLSDAIKQGVTAERIGNAWKRALSSSDARFWPFHCVIEKLPTLEAEPPKQSKAKSRLSQDEIEAAAKKAWANAFGGALVCDKK